MDRQWIFDLVGKNFRSRKVEPRRGPIRLGSNLFRYGAGASNLSLHLWEEDPVRFSSP